MYMYLHINIIVAWPYSLLIWRLSEYTMTMHQGWRLNWFSPARWDKPGLNLGVTSLTWAKLGFTGFFLEKITLVHKFIYI
jgi:hypothetical protein